MARAGEDRRIGIITVALVFGEGVAIIVHIVGIGEGVVAVAVFVNPVAGNLNCTGEDGRVSIVAIAGGFAEPVTIIVGGGRIDGGNRGGSGITLFGPVA